MALEESGEYGKATPLYRPRCIRHSASLGLPIGPERARLKRPNVRRILTRPIADGAAGIFGRHNALGCDFRNVQTLASRLRQLESAFSNKRTRAAFVVGGSNIIETNVAHTLLGHFLFRAQAQPKEQTAPDSSPSSFRNELDASLHSPPERHPSSAQTRQAPCRGPQSSTPMTRQRQRRSPLAR